MSESVAKHRESAPEKVRVAVLTVSDTRTPETDTGGDAVQGALEGAGHAVVDRTIVRDDAARIRTALVNALARADVDAVVTSGGTGISAGVGLGGTGVAYGQDGDPDLLRGGLPVLLDALAHSRPPPARNGLLASSSPIVVAGPCPG